MKILKLHLENFRHFNNVDIEFGSKITVISGQNGTGKSSILGWVAQLCDFKEAIYRIDGGKFKEDYKNVFRFCPKKDWSKKYSVKFEYGNNELIPSEKTIKTRYQEKSLTSEARYRTDFDGRGNALNHPVIYLGLKRLIPLATEKKIDIHEVSISSKHTCFRDYKNESNQNIAKAWFNDVSIKNDFFGNNYSKLFNRWKENHLTEVNTFIDSIRKIL